jgi:hypothetical protein
LSLSLALVGGGAEDATSLRTSVFANKMVFS